MIGLGPGSVKAVGAGPCFETSPIVQINPFLIGRVVPILISFILYRSNQYFKNGPRSVKRMKTVYLWSWNRPRSATAQRTVHPARVPIWHYKSMSHILKDPFLKVRFLLLLLIFPKFRPYSTSWPQFFQLWKKCNFRLMVFCV